MKYFIGLVCFLLLVSEKIPAQVPATTIPPFKFFRLNKSAFTNNDLVHGKDRFFIFFDSDCEHCRHAITAINQHYSECKKITFYLLSLDSSEKINQFLNNYGKNLIGKSNVIILQDSNNEFIQKFGPRKYPSMFLYTYLNKLLLYDDDEQNFYKFLTLIKKAI